MVMRKSSFKRNLSLLPLTVVLFGTLVLKAQETFYDRSEQDTYTNNDGSMEFATGWIENSETIDWDAGRIRIRGNELEIRNMDNGFTIERSLDLSPDNSKL